MCLFHEINMTSYTSASKAVVPRMLLVRKTKLTLSYYKNRVQGSN